MRYDINLFYVKSVGRAFALPTYRALLAYRIVRYFANPTRDLYACNEIAHYILVDLSSPMPSIPSSTYFLPLVSVI